MILRMMCVFGIIVVYILLLNIRYGEQGGSKC